MSAGVAAPVRPAGGPGIPPAVPTSAEFHFTQSESFVDFGHGDYFSGAIKQRREHRRRRAQDVEDDAHCLRQIAVADGRIFVRGEKNLD